jgi:hypothetical protein
VPGGRLLLVVAGLDRALERVLESGHARGGQ